MAASVRTKNSKAHTALESAYLADVKRCTCVVCNAPAPSSAHHTEQGLHFNTIALCWDCHQGPHGWHGDRSRWRAAKMTEAKSMNETRRRVEELRSPQREGYLARVFRSEGQRLEKKIVAGLSSSKILPRRDT